MSIAVRHETVLIEVTTELLETWFTRDRDGNRLSMVLGEPTDMAHIRRYGSDRGLPVYTPAITVHYDDNPWREPETLLAKERKQAP